MAIGTRERLLDTALAVFSEQGSAGATMREIARRAGVNVATPYHHFGSKRDLLMAVFQERGLLDLPEEPTALALSDDPREGLTILILGAWMQMSASQDVIRLALIEVLAGDEDVREVFDAWRERGDAFLERAVEGLGIAEGDDVTSLAWLVRQVIWATFMEQIMGGPADLEELAPLARRASERLVP